MARTWIIGVLLLGACTDNGSLGNYDTGTGDGSGGESSSQTETGATQTSATTASTVSATTDSASTTSVSDSDTGFGTTGDPLMCDGGNGCPLSMSCGEQWGCGWVPSIFDEHACVRPTCQGDDACGDLERCFIAMDFGMCEASATQCEDEGPDSGCDCGGTADCNGGHCVPALEYPPAIVQSLPTTSVLALGCGPDDGVVVSLRVYDEGPLDGCTPPEGATAVLDLTFVDAAVEVGEYDLLAATATGVGMVRLPDQSVEPVWRAHMSIDSVDDESAVVDVDLDTFADNVVLASWHWEIGRANVCPLEAPCG